VKNPSLITKYQGGNLNSFIAWFKTVYKQCLDKPNSSVSTFKSCNNRQNADAYYILSVQYHWLSIASIQ